MDDQSDENNVSVDLSQGDEVPDEPNEDEGFDHPEDVPVTDAETIPEVNSADDAVGGDEDLKRNLEQTSQKLKDEREADDADETDDEGTPVHLGDDAGDEADDDRIEQASDSVFSDEEAQQLEEEYAEEFDIKPIEDIPDDFDYEDQDTSHFGADDQEIDIRHEGVVFHLEQPRGMREDKFWSSIQENPGMAGMFDSLIRYTVTKPENVGERMDAENWTGFAKAGLAIKCSSFLGLDALQDF